MPDAPSPKLRVLQLVSRRQLRGAEVFAAQLVEHLAARGHELTLAALYAPRDPPLEVRGGASLDLHGRRRGVPTYRLLRRLARVLERWRPDIVQANGSDTLKVAVLARWLSRHRPPLVYRNISLASAWLRSPLHRAVNGWLARRVDRVASLSQSTACDYAETYQLPRQRIVIIPIGTEIPTAGELTAERRRAAAVLEADSATASPGPRLLHVGSLTAEKGHDVLLDSFLQLLEHFPEARLILVGDGPERPGLERRIEAPDLAGRVRLLGARPDARELMSAADLLVLPSRVEGLPGVVLEAAVRRLPVVASDVGSVSDAVLDGRTGVLVPAGDAGSLAAALTKLLADPELRRRMGDAGRRHISEQFDIHDIADRFERLYLDLAATTDG